MKKKIDNTIIEIVSRVLAEELTGYKIDKMFAFLNFKNFDEAMNKGYTSTKWKRLNESIIHECRQKSNATPLFRAIEYITQPAEYIDEPTNWENLLSSLNKKLIFYGYMINDSGKVSEIDAVTSFSDAQKRLTSFTDRLSNYETHPEVLKYCSNELFSENYFHAILEASKGLLQRVRDLSMSTSDGSTLINEVFINKNPILVIEGNRIETSSEKSEYNGLKSLLNTIVYFYRNPKAHEPKLYNHSSESDAVTAFTLISMAHTILDNCVRVR
ncbi:MAG: TIGR02391 family protein [Vagococcus salmoninarum]|uniref:TIGR02391 family protein n=1 Tax=Vagococcus salmoninarum TaxID=2739 RepID=UPI003F96B021